MAPSSPPLLLAANNSSSPNSLLDLCTARIAIVLCSGSAKVNQPAIWDALTDNMRHNLLTKLPLLNREDVMAPLMRDVPTFFRLLGLGNNRMVLHELFQYMTEKPHTPLHVWLTEDIESELDTFLPATTKYVCGCLSFAGFLVDGGWYALATRVLSAVSNAIDAMRGFVVDKELAQVNNECQLRLLQALSNDGQLEKAKALYETLSKSIPEHTYWEALYYEQFVAHCLSRSLYYPAFCWAVRAVQSLRPEHPPKVTIDVLRHASRACVLRRKFGKAQVLIEKAVLTAKAIYGPEHLKFSDALMDYGFYLLNVDSVDKSVQAYSLALDVRKKTFKRSLNLRIASSLEDLAYASYVRNYNSGLFLGAQEMAESALAILDRILPPNHILRSSPYRVLALILEEIAIDEPNRSQKHSLLQRAEELHIRALKLSIDAYGLMNVQTAKHYGNLGRLYQSMSKYPQAEQMHIKAICIKEKLLGSDDYEVALSVGHLASLYNYDMKQFQRAEALYLRSIAIGKRLFGNAYSGLEYDYRGLLRVYRETECWDKVVDCMAKIRRWQELRDEKRQSEIADEEEGLLSKAKNRPLEEVVEDLLLDVDQDDDEDAKHASQVEKKNADNAAYGSSMMALLSQSSLDDVLSQDLGLDSIIEKINSQEEANK